MNSRRKVVLIGPVFLALLAFGVWIATGKRQSATMASEAVVTLEEVTCGLNIASHVHSVDALIAVRRSRFVEFLAKPEFKGAL
jgi:hypothetical protein